MSTRRPVIVVLDRAGAATAALLARLRAHGMRAVPARDPEAARRALGRERADGVIVAVRGARVALLPALREVRADHPSACVILTVDVAAMRRAAGAMREGAWDVIARPVDPERLLIVLDRGLTHRRLLERPAGREDAPSEAGGDALLGRSRAITRVMEQVRHLASGHATVLVEGEAGTGRGGAAWALHALGPRRDLPFVAMDCAAGGPAALERELFGVGEPEEDARPGALERADGGTLYLEDIAAAPPAVQIRLLRLLQERAFERVGGRATLRVDVRLIAGATPGLEGAVREGRFREDLHRRLALARITMPPLRERREDIPALVERFMRDARRRHPRRVKGVTRGTLERLQHHVWPGNLRELRDTVESMMVSAPGGRPLDLTDLPPALRGGGDARERVEIAPGMTVEAAERELIAATLAHVGHDRPRAAAMLGIGLRTLYRKIKEYGLR